VSLVLVHLLAAIVGWHVGQAFGRARAARIEWLLVEGDWLHRPWWKVAINTALRAFQPQPRKWVVYTRTEGGSATAPPRVLGYGFGRVLHRPTP
jgi:hypothetical protein